MKSEKLNFLRSLLQKHYGPDWINDPNLQLYKQHFMDQQAILQEGDNLVNLAEEGADEIPAQEENVLGV